MLPEILADAVAFLPLYDLDSALFANRQLSSIASDCVKGIRIWQFIRVDFVVHENQMFLREKAMDVDGRDTLIAVEGRENMAEALEIALHNACFKVLSFFVAPDAVIPLPNKSSLMVKKLGLGVEGLTPVDFLVDVVARFRKVVNLFECETIADFSPVVDLCRQKGIRRITHDGEDLMERR